MYTISLSDPSKTNISIVDMEKLESVKLTPEFLAGRTAHFHTGLVVAVYPDITSPEWTEEPDGTKLRGMRFCAENVKTGIKRRFEDDPAIVILGADSRKFQDRCKKLIEKGDIKVVATRAGRFMDLEIKPGPWAAKVVVHADKWVTFDDEDAEFETMQVVP